MAEVQMNSCSIDGCSRYAAPGLMCEGHTQRVRETGTPGPAAFRRYIPSGASLEDRLKIIGWDTTETGCWIWRGRVNTTQTTHVYGSLDFKLRSTLAHRAAFEVWIRPLTEGEVVMHKCDTPLCINPAHLRAGTQKENLNDRDAKGHHANTKKTACKWGHEFTPENTRFTINASGTPSRKCRTCQRLRERGIHPAQTADR